MSRDLYQTEPTTAEERAAWCSMVVAEHVLASQDPWTLELFAYWRKVAAFECQFMWGPMGVAPPKGILECLP